MLGAVTEAIEQRLILELMGELTGLRVLDAGCGAGALVCVAVSRGVDATGIDPDPAMLSAARSRAAGTVTLVVAEQTLWKAGRIFRWCQIMSRMCRRMSAKIRSLCLLTISASNLALAVNINAKTSARSLRRSRIGQITPSAASCQPGSVRDRNSSRPL